MTAINPAKLKIQTAELGELVNQPDQFVIQLHELLSFYSARIRGTNKSSTSRNLKTYQAPIPVIATLISEILERLQEEPEPGYPLVDALWQEPWIEFRRLAIRVLGVLPGEEPDRILQRLQDWLKSCPSEEIRRLIMTEGMLRIAKEEPDACLHFLSELISSGSKETLQAALFGLESFARNPAYPNLPLLFRYLSNIIQRNEPGLTKEINTLVQHLASRSEQETTYYLLTQLGPDPKPGILRVIRKIIGSLSAENQRLLREKMDRYKK